MSISTYLHTTLQTTDGTYILKDFNNIYYTERINTTNIMCNILCVVCFAGSIGSLQEAQDVTQEVTL